MKLTPKQAGIVFVRLVSVLMTAVMSFAILTLRPGLLTIWSGDFLVGCLFSIPTGFLLVPLLRRWIDKHTRYGMVPCRSATLPSTTQCPVGKNPGFFYLLCRLLPVAVAGRRSAGTLARPSQHDPGIPQKDHCQWVTV